MSVLYIKGKDGKFVPIFTVKGADGSNGIDGAGIEDIKYKSSEGLEDTYEITYTDDRTPTYFTVTNGENGKTPEITIGDDGNWHINGKDTGVKAQGEDGVSPTVEIFETTHGTRVSITDKTTRHEFDVLNGKDGTSVEHRWEGTILYVTSAGVTSSADLKGEKGDTGEGFRISKTYKSLAEMKQGYDEGDGVPKYGFVLIDAEDVEDEDNAKLYVKGENGYEFLTDLSGAQGLQGVGIQSIEKTASNGVVDTYTITYTDGNKTTFTVRNSENLNIENGSGNYSLQQKGADEIKASATGEYSTALGRESESLQYGCFTSGGETQAGRTKKEWNDWISKHQNDEENAAHTFHYYPNGESYVTINRGTYSVNCYYNASNDKSPYEVYATALGELCKAPGRGCFAAGLGAKIEEGYAAVALGLNSELTTKGLFPSFNIGGYLYSYGDYIFNIGHNSTIGKTDLSSSYLYSIGRDNTIYGEDVFAFGLGLKSTHDNQNRGKVLLGRYNEDLNPNENPYPYSILEFGDGKDKDNRYNVFHIYKKNLDLWTNKGNYVADNYVAELKSSLSIYEGVSVGKGVSTNIIGDRSSVSDDGVQDGNVWKAHTSLSLGYENNIKSIQSMTLGTYNIIGENCSLNYVIGDNNIVENGVSGATLVGRGLKVGSGDKTVLGRFNQELNWTADEATGSGAYSIFELGDGSQAIDNNGNLVRQGYNVVQIYKDNADAYGESANYTTEIYSSVIAKESLSVEGTSSFDDESLFYGDVQVNGELNAPKINGENIYAKIFQGDTHNGSSFGSNNNPVNGTNAFAYGKDNTFVGEYCYAYGGENSVDGQHNVVVGKSNTIEWYGYETVIPTQNYIFGHDNYIYELSSSSTIIGRNCYIQYGDTYAFGDGLKSYKDTGKILLGRYNEDVTPATGKCIFELGDGTEDAPFTVINVRKEDVEAPVHETKYTAEIKGDLVLSRVVKDGNPIGDMKTLTTDNIICWNQLSANLITSTSRELDINSNRINLQGYVNVLESLAVDGDIYIGHKGKAITANDLLDKVYPVGSIYMSTVDESPASFLGGTWTRIENQFLLSASKTYTAGSSGGNATHTHKISGYAHITGGSRASGGYAIMQDTIGSNVSYTKKRETTASSINVNYSPTTETVYTGTPITATNTSESNIPPYLAVYMWKRIQ